VVVLVAQHVVTLLQCSTPVALLGSKHRTGAVSHSCVLHCSNVCRAVTCFGCIRSHHEAVVLHILRLYQKPSSGYREYGAMLE
jgi:hypothetical protein